MNTKADQYFTPTHLKAVQCSPSDDEFVFVSKRSIFEKIRYPKRMRKRVVVEVSATQAMLDQLQHNSESVRLEHLDITNYASTHNIVNTFNTHKYIDHSYHSKRAMPRTTILPNRP